MKLVHALAAALIAGLIAGCAPAAAPAAQPAATAAPAPSASQPTSAPASSASAPTSAPDEASARPPAEPMRVRTGATWTSFTQMPIFYAEEKGYFREVGIEIERETIPTSDRMIPPLATNQLDVGAAGFGAGLYNAIARNVTFKLVADNGQSAGTSSGALVVRQELMASGQVRDYPDLRGRRVGLAGRGTGLHITLARALDKGGLTFDDVEMIELPFSDLSAALSNGAIDAALHAEPYVALGVEQGLLGVLKWMDEIYPDQQFNAIMYSPQFASDKDTANRFMVAYLRGARDYNEVIRKGRNLDEFAAIGAKHLPIRDTSLYPKMRQIAINPDGYLNRRGMEDDLTWYIGQGLVRERLDLDALIDYSFVDAALARLGRYQ